MPRKDRFETVSDCSTHHIVQRGLNKGDIFRDVKDYSIFKNLMKRYLARHKIKIYNYCLMPNHTHLLVLVEIASHLSSFMQALSLSYSFYYRKKYEYSGYLWQGRFKNFWIEKDSYLLECARYIERNPLKIGCETTKLCSFKWSSYNFYANGSQDELITTNPIYEEMGNTFKERQDRYKEYVLIPRPYEEALDEIFIPAERREVAPRETDPLLRDLPAERELVLLKDKLV